MSKILTPEEIQTVILTAEYGESSVRLNQIAIKVCESHEALRTRLEAALLLCDKYNKYSNAKRDSIVFNDAIKEWEERKLIGSNKMELNAATMMAALQYYFDNVLFAEGKSPKVIGIAETGKISATFSITTSASNEPDESKGEKK